MEQHRINYISPENSEFSITDGDTLQLKTNGIIYPHVKVFRSYPLNQTNKYISLKNASTEDEPEIGIIKDLDEFPQNTKYLILLKLDKRYFVPVIKKIVFLEEKGDHLSWEVETDRGTRKFTVRNSYDNIYPLKNGKFIVIDTHACRYEIPDNSLFQGKALGILSRHIYL